MTLKQQHPVSWLSSAIAVAAFASFLFVLRDWHSHVKTTNDTAASSSTPSRSSRRRRSLVQMLDLLQDTPPSAFDDDITRDDTCREYLMNFLNGTTDAKDECTAMYKAWQVADCKDYNSKNKDNPSSHDLSRRHETQDGNWTDDDILIDDAFEKWECCGSISDFYAKHCQQHNKLDAFKLLAIVLVLLVCGLMKSLIRVMGVQWIPDAGACIVVGALVGLLLRIVHVNVVQDDDKVLTFDNDLFLHIMLPPIIFEAAISIDKRAFRRDLFPILTFAIVGTGFSAVAIGLITHYLSAIGSGSALPMLDSLLFGALMSSIDPVATLGILSSVGVNQGDTLYTLIFGESLLNDGVAIVLFDSLVRHMGDATVVDQATIHDTLWNFVIVSLASIAIGIACGALCTLYFYALQGKQSAVTEVALFFAWALVPYYIADGVGFSGIISIMVMGFMLDYYVIGGFQSDEGEWMEYMEVRRGCPGDNSHPVEPCFHRIKECCCKAFSGRGLILSRSRHHVGFVAEVISTLMETAIFAYLGLFLFNDRVWDFKLNFAGLFACVSSRAVMVILFSLLINVCVWLDLEGLFGRLWKCIFHPEESRDDDTLYEDTRVYLDKKTQLILFSAGVRGAVSYALVQNIPVYDAVTKHGSHFKGELRSMTSFAIVVILFSFGALTYFTVQRDLSLERVASGGSSLNRRLLSTLASEDEGDGGSSNSAFEIEGRPGSTNHR